MTDAKLDDIIAANPLDGTERVYVVQDITGTPHDRRTTTQDIADLVTPASGGRTTLSVDTTYYVRKVVGEAVFTNGSDEVTITGHGLSVDDLITFSILANKQKIAVSDANPAVFTSYDQYGLSTEPHNLVAGQPVQFKTPGYMGPAFDRFTTYYVLASGLTTDEFQVSDTPGGTPLDNTPATFTASSGTVGALKITASKNHNLVAGQQIAFINSGGALPTGLAANTLYYVASSPAPTSTEFYVATTNGGTNVSYTDAGTGTHSLNQTGSIDPYWTIPRYGSDSRHFVESGIEVPSFANIPDFITTYGPWRLGEPLYVGEIVDADTIKLSSEPANASPVGATTISANPPPFTATTGNDDTGDGSAANPWWSFDAAIAYLRTIDFGSAEEVTLQISDGRINDFIRLEGSFVGQAAAYSFILSGNLDKPGNCQLGMGIAASSAYATISGFRVMGQGVYADGNSQLFFDGPIEFNEMMFSSCFGSTGGGTNIQTPDKISVDGIDGFLDGFNAPDCLFATNKGGLQSGGTTIVTLLGVPSFGTASAVMRLTGTLEVTNFSFAGGAIGARYDMSGNSAINTGTGDPDFLPGDQAGVDDGTGSYA